MKNALLLSLLALGALGLVACGGSGDDQATAASGTETTAASGTDLARKSCGDITHGPRPSKVAVVEGNLPCRVARRVVADFLTSGTPGPIWIETELPGRFTRDSWACHGPQGNVMCKRKREARSPSWGKVRGHYYGCCDSTAASEADPVATKTLSNEERIEQQGNKWAAEFAADRGTCRYMGQPACERLACERVPNRPIKNCTPPSAEFRESFADATVERVALYPHPHAIAEFSNGESVEFEGQRADEGDIKGWGHWAFFITERWIKNAGRR